MQNSLQEYGNKKLVRLALPTVPEKFDQVVSAQYSIEETVRALSDSGKNDNVCLTLRNNKEYFLTV